MKNFDDWNPRFKEPAKLIISKYAFKELEE
jgi:hypothetical protein